MDTSKLTPGVIVILAAGLVILVFSFLPFYTDVGGGGGGGNAEEICREQVEDLGGDPDILCQDVPGGGGGGGDDKSAWSEGFLPVATLPVIYGFLMAIQVALAKFANVKFPERILGLTWPQIHIALGINAALLMLAALVLDKGNADFGIGFWFMLLAALALPVGAFLYRNEEARGPAVPPPPPSAPPPPPA